MTVGLVFLGGAIWFRTFGNANANNANNTNNTNDNNANTTNINANVNIDTYISYTPSTALPPSFSSAYLVWFYALILLVGNNRWLTLFVTFSRALAVSGLRGAQRSLSKTPRRLWLETLFFGVVVGFAQSGVRWGVYRLLMDAGRKTAAGAVVVANLDLIVVVMASLAGFILFKTRRRQNGASSFFFFFL